MHTTSRACVWIPNERDQNSFLLRYLQPPSRLLLFSRSHPFALLPSLLRPEHAEMSNLTERKKKVLRKTTMHRSSLREPNFIPQKINLPLFGQSFVRFSPQKMEYNCLLAERTSTASSLRLHAGISVMTVSKVLLLLQVFRGKKAAVFHQSTGLY